MIATTIVTASEDGMIVPETPNLGNLGNTEILLQLKREVLKMDSNKDRCELDLSCQLRCEAHLLMPMFRWPNFAPATTSFAPATTSFAPTTTSFAPATTNTSRRYY